MTAHLSTPLLVASSAALSVGVLGLAAPAWATLGRARRSALTHRALLGYGLLVGLASLTGRLPLDLSAYAAVAAALLVPLRWRLGSGLLVAAVLGALARGDVEVHQRPVVLGGLAVGVLCAVTATLVWQLLDPLPAVGEPVRRRSTWAQLLAPSPVDLDHLDAIIDGTDPVVGGSGRDTTARAPRTAPRTPHPPAWRDATR